MKHILFGSLAGMAMMAFSLGAFAQDTADPDAYHTDRDAYFQGKWHARMFERVRDDVKHVQMVTWPGGGDKFRLAKTADQLSELQGKFVAHDYDQKELDDVIGTLQRVVAYNKLRPRDHDMLNDDLMRLRNFRDHHDTWDER